MGREWGVGDGLLGRTARGARPEEGLVRLFFLSFFLLSLYSVRPLEGPYGGVVDNWDHAEIGLDRILGRSWDGGIMVGNKDARDSSKFPKMGRWGFTFALLIS